MPIHAHNWLSLARSEKRSQSNRNGVKVSIDIEQATMNLTKSRWLVCHAILFLTARVLAFVSVTAVPLVGWSSNASDTAQVRGMIDGKALRLTGPMQRELAEESVRVLKSCTYANLHPTGEYASTVAHAQERSYLLIEFSEPRSVALSVGKREVPSGKVNLKFREMVITLPLSSGAFLVRANKETFYFAKFDCPVSQELEKKLKEAQK